MLEEIKSYMYIAALYLAEPWYILIERYCYHVCIAMFSRKVISFCLHLAIIRMQFA